MSTAPVFTFKFKGIAQVVVVERILEQLELIPLPPIYALMVSFDTQPPTIGQQKQNHYIPVEGTPTAYHTLVG